jgi:calcium/calmodulin-dependent protein kinase I
MHGTGTVHRDLKPENLLFKNNDKKIIKIADFGESKSFKEGSLTTYCGTPDYMAPEIIRGDPYSSEVDVWAVGVITYVMLAGFPPFDGENDVEVFASILSIRYSFPTPEWDNISEEAKHFIRSILLDNPKERLSAAQALQHPWIVNHVSEEMRTNQKKESKKMVEQNSKVKVIEEKKTDLGSSTRKSNLSGSLNSSGFLTDSGNSRIHRKESDFDPVKHSNPRKYLLEEMEEVLQRLGDSNVAITGELHAMIAILEVSSGKKPLIELERSIYTIYHKRLSDIKYMIKPPKKKKKNRT